MKLIDFLKRVIVVLQQILQILHVTIVEVNCDQPNHPSKYVWLLLDCLSWFYINVHTFMQKQPLIFIPGNNFVVAVPEIVLNQSTTQQRNLYLMQLVTWVCHRYCCSCFCILKTERHQMATSNSGNSLTLTFFIRFNCISFLINIRECCLMFLMELNCY